MLGDDGVVGVELVRLREQLVRFRMVAEQPLFCPGLHQLRDDMLARDGERERVLVFGRVELRGPRKRLLRGGGVVVAKLPSSGQIGIRGFADVIRRGRTLGGSYSVYKAKRQRCCGGVKVSSMSG